MSGMEMDFTTVHIYKPTPVSEIVALLLIVLYVPWLAFYLRRASRRQTGSLLLLLLPPLVLSATAAWIGYANIVRAAALAGDGSAAAAAGVAETLMMLCLGAGATIICTGMALIAVARTRYDAIGPVPRAPIAIASLCWLTSLTAVGLAPVIAQSGRGFAMFNTTLIAAFLSLALLIPLAVVAVIANRIVVPRRAQLIALATTLTLALIQIAVAWKLIGHYRLIAMGR